MCPAPPSQPTSSATTALTPAPPPPQPPRPRPGSVVLRAPQVSRLIPAAPPAPSAPQIPSAAASPDSSPPQTAPSSPATTPAFQKIQILRPTAAPARDRHPLDQQAYESSEECPYSPLPQPSVRVQSASRARQSFEARTLQQIRVKEIGRASCRERV